VAGMVMVPSHTLVTNYRYNTLNQVATQQSPDGGMSNFWYDRLGRLAVSQNRKQLPGSQYSYTQYDTIGRITQVGQLSSSTTITPTISRNDSTLQLWLGSASSTVNQITVTSYDSGAYAIQPIIGQRNMRNRVSWTALFDTATDLANGGQNAAAATYYSYDILGNVDTLLQDFGGGVHHSDVANPMNTTRNRFKKISYNFDLVSKGVFLNASKLNLEIEEESSTESFAAGVVIIDGFLNLLKRFGSDLQFKAFHQSSLNLFLAVSQSTSSSGCLV
jgi:hypothetical protein